MVYIPITRTLAQRWRRIFKFSKRILESPRLILFERMLTISQSESNVKSLVPPDRLLILDLEEGFGFNEICHFLDRPIPDEEYPRSNALAEFNAAAEYILAPATRKVKLISSTALIGTTAVLLGFLLKGHSAFH